MKRSGVPSFALLFVIVMVLGVLLSRWGFSKRLLTRQPPSLSFGKLNTTSADSPVPKIVRMIWFGAEMSDNRRRCANTIMTVIGKHVPIELITEKNLQVYQDLVPLHPCFQYLSAIHKSDYLRGYLGHHWGGGYVDIKPYKASWQYCFDVFEDTEVWLAGTPELSRNDVAGNDDSVKDMWRQLASCCSYIMRPRTPYSNALLTGQNALLDLYADDLRAHPAQCDRCSFPNAGDYPISWNSLWGAILHPLQAEILSHIRLNLPRWEPYEDFPYK